MGAPIPCLGYRSRTAAALALRAQGKTEAQIATAMGISRNALSGLIASADRQIDRRVTFPARVLDQLRPHAARRGIGEKDLARQIVTVAATENMIDSILDDLEG